MSIQDKTNIAGEIKVYEIGYVLVSSIPEEKVLGSVTNIKDLLDKKKAEIIGEETPTLINLAYSMTKKIGAINHKYNQGYFGWIKFAVSSDDIGDIKVSLDGNNDILRYLLINTVRENTYMGKRATSFVKEERDETVAPQEGKEVVATPAPQASVEEMDKTIDEIVKEA